MGQRQSLVFVRYDTDLRGHDTASFMGRRFAPRMGLGGLKARFHRLYSFGNGST